MSLAPERGRGRRDGARGGGRSEGIAGLGRNRWWVSKRVRDVRRLWWLRCVLMVREEGGGLRLMWLRLRRALVAWLHCSLDW